VKEFTELENQHETTMKKLMIAAAAAAMVSGVYAGNCEPDATTPKSGALVYSFKMNVKTTKGVAGSTTKDTSTQCQPGSSTSCSVIREKDSTVIQGYIYDCALTCDTISTGTVIAWDSKRKVNLDSPAFTTTFINVMGKKQTVAEWAWTFAGKAEYDETRSQEYALTGAGYGTYDTKNDRYTSFSGNFAGTATASYDLKTMASTKVTCACDPSQIWKCAALNELAASDTVAFGTWTAKYDASASKKYFNNGTLKTPQY
jgi:hypothetical protein